LEFLIRHIKSWKIPENATQQSKLWKKSVLLWEENSKFLSLIRGDSFDQEKS